MTAWSFHYKGLFPPLQLVICGLITVFLNNLLSSYLLSIDNPWINQLFPWKWQMVIFLKKILFCLYLLVHIFPQRRNSCFLSPSFYYFFIFYKFIYGCVGSQLQHSVFCLVVDVTHELLCSMWDLSSQIRDRTHVPWIGRWIRNHWAARDILSPSF